MHDPAMVRGVSTQLCCGLQVVEDRMQQDWHQASRMLQCDLAGSLSCAAAATTRASSTSRMLRMRDRSESTHDRVGAFPRFIGMSFHLPSASRNKCTCLSNLLSIRHSGTMLAWCRTLSLLHSILGLQTLTQPQPWWSSRSFCTLDLSFASISWPGI